MWVVLFLVLLVVLLLGALILPAFFNISCSLFMRVISLWVSFVLLFFCGGCSPLSFCLIFMFLLVLSLQVLLLGVLVLPALFEVSCSFYVSLVVPLPILLLGVLLGSWALCQMLEGIRLLGGVLDICVLSGALHSFLGLGLFGLTLSIPLLGPFLLPFAVSDLSGAVPLSGSSLSGDVTLYPSRSCAFDLLGSAASQSTPYLLELGVSILTVAAPFFGPFPVGLGPS